MSFPDRDLVDADDARLRMSSQAELLAHIDLVEFLDVLQSRCISRATSWIVIVRHRPPICMAKRKVNFVLLDRKASFSFFTPQALHATRRISKSR